MKDYQLVKNQCLKDKGPVPEGLYKVFINDMGEAEDNGANTCTLKPAWGIQSIPRGVAAESASPIGQIGDITAHAWNLQTLRLK